MTSTPDLRRICRCDRRSGIGPHWHSLQEGCTREPTCKHGQPADNCKTCVVSRESVPNSMIPALLVNATTASLDEPEHDPVNHPSHYTSSPARCSCGASIECIQVIEHMPHCLGAAVKYIWRCGIKEGADELEDLRKARWYIDREIQRRERAA